MYVCMYLCMYVCMLGHRQLAKVEDADGVCDCDKKTHN